MALAVLCGNWRQIPMKTCLSAKLPTDYGEIFGLAETDAAVYNDAAIRVGASRCGAEAFLAGEAAGGVAQAQTYLCD